MEDIIVSITRPTTARRRNITAIITMMMMTMVEEEAVVAASTSNFKIISNNCMNITTITKRALAMLVGKHFWVRIQFVN